MSDSKITQQTSDASSALSIDYQDLVNTALVGVASSTLDGEILYVNQALASMLEYDSPENILVEGALSHWLVPELRQSFISELQQQGYVRNYEIDAVTRTGKTIHILMSATLQGDVISSVFFDITARRAAEEALRDSEKKFIKAQEMAHLGNWEWDIQNNRITWSDEIYRIYGIDRDTPLTYERLKQAIHPEDRQYHDTHTTEWLNNRGGDPFEYRIIRTDGSVRYVFAAGEVECDDAGEPIRFAGIVQDISERKRAEHAILEYQQRLKSLASELTFAGERERRKIAAELHDHVGQTLAVMRMQLAAARKETSGRKVDSVLDEVSESLRLAIQDTRNIMSDLSSSALNELGLSAAIADWLREQIGERHGLQTRFSDDCDPKLLSEDIRATLFRSVRELLMNVVKHASANLVTVSIQCEGNAVRIVVEDNGTGLPARTGHEYPAGEGGFGLFSIEERINDLGGSLSIESAHGQGVRAILTVPLETD